MLGAAITIPFLALLLAVVVAGVVVGVRRRRLAVDEARYPRLAHLRRTTRRARLAGIGGGLVAAVVVAVLPGAWRYGGRGLLLAPLVFGVVLTAALIVGDLSAHGDARSDSGTAAALAADPRRRRDILPPALTAAVGGVVVICATLLAVGWVLGLPDVTGPHPGSSLQWSSAAGDVGIGHGPWPGAYYGRLLAPAALVLLALLAVGLGITARRPRDGSDPEIARVDALVRRREAEALLGATGGPLAVIAVLLACMEAVGLFALAAGIERAGLPVDPACRVGGWLCLASTVVTLPVGVWCAVAVLVPASSPRDRAVATGSARPAPAEGVQGT